MGFLNFGKKHAQETVEPKAPSTGYLDLSKNVLDLNKVVLDLSKSTGMNLNTHKARICMVLDFSGSMRSEYRSGAMQEVLTRLLPLAMKFDDNGELECWLFHDDSFRLPPLTERNYQDYVNKEIIHSGIEMGGTSYAPVLEDVREKYFSEDPGSDPVFCIFITDGANMDERKTDKIIRRMSSDKIWIQFVGMGDSSFKYLEKLDDLDGRVRDNTGFMKVSSFKNMSNEELYTALLNDYPAWLKQVGF